MTTIDTVAATPPPAESPPQPAAGSEPSPVGGVITVSPGHHPAADAAQEAPSGEAPSGEAPSGEALPGPEPAPIPPAGPGLARAEAAVRGEATAEAGQKPGSPRGGSDAPASILTIDIGGTNVKILVTGQTEPRKAPTGKDFTPAHLVETVRSLAHDWEYEAITIGCPALVGPNGPRSEPGNLGPGWVGFDFGTAFGKPVKMINDAAMQALGSYEGGRMLFLGLGTGLGSALIAGNVIIPLELGRLLYDTKRTLGEVLGRAGLERIGKAEWREAVNRSVTALMGAFVADYVVVGGGNAKRVKGLPPGVRMGHNLTAFRGGFVLWSVSDAWVLASPGGESGQPNPQEALRLL